VFAAPGVSFAGTRIAGFEDVPATRLPEGADAGFIYLDAPASGIPTGFYRLNARAEAPRLGSYDGSVGLISADERFKVSPDESSGDSSGDSSFQEHRAPGAYVPWLRPWG
jgi:hypothetical protein